MSSGSIISPTTPTTRSQENMRGLSWGSRMKARTSVCGNHAVQPDEQPAGRLTLREVPDGTWAAQWIDTVEARPAGRETVTSRNGILVLRTPATAKSVVVRLERRTEAGGQGRE